MSLTIRNSLSSQASLVNLNKNNNQLSEDLKKISTGARIAGAKDGASDYSISESMRVKIRALGQDIRNVQNGCSLLKTAMGGVDEIVSELRSLKELALNSCNDHNTDNDRAILQKEFDARKAHIEDIAIETNYNGIPLLDGHWSRYKILGGGFVNETNDSIKKQGYVTSPFIDYTSELSDAEPIIINNGTTEITEDGVYEFARNYRGTLTVSAKNVQLNGPKNGRTLDEVYIKDNGVENLYIKDLKIENNRDLSTISFDSSSNNKLHMFGENYIYAPGGDNAIIHVGGGLEIVGTGSIDIDFNNYAVNGAIIGSNSPRNWGDNEAILCGDIIIGQGVTVNIQNNGAYSTLGAGIGNAYWGLGVGNILICTGATVNIDVSGDHSGTDGPAIGTGIDDLGSGVVGVKDITIFSGANVNVKAHYGAGIGTAQVEGICGDITIYSDAKVTASSEWGAGIGNGGGHIVNGYGKNIVGDITIYSYSSGDVKATTGAQARAWGAEDIGRGYCFDDYDGSILNTGKVGRVNFINFPDEYNHTESDGHTTIRKYKTLAQDANKHSPLIIHTGAKANQNIPIYMENMRLNALGIKNTLINTRQNAGNSLNAIDTAIDYALDQATSLGAYYNELESTKSNLTTANENTIASESVIRDADIAREMTNFTKHNILSQAAQAMLSQANKDAGNIVSLLQ